jgi:hypothetical protein
MEVIEVRDEKLSAEDKAVSVENIEVDDGKAKGRWEGHLSAHRQPSEGGLLQQASRPNLRNLA